MYKVCWGRISSCEEKKDGNIMAAGKNITWEKGNNIIFPIILRLLGRILSEENGKGTEISGKKIKMFKNGVGEEYHVVGNFIHPCK